jgi:ribose/xylose/arabinose/galactoside ABC-type transport system permease subunit
MASIASPPAPEASADASGGGREAEARRRSRGYRLRQSAVDVLALFVVVQVGSIVYGLIRPDALPYTSFANVQTSLEAIPLIGIPALGVGVLMIAGEFDLSVGANYVFSSIVGAHLVASGVNPFLAVLAALAIGTGIGLVNGIVTLGLRIPSFITTLGSTGIWTAATLLVNGSGSIEFQPGSSFFTSMVSGNVGVLCAEFGWFVAAGVAIWALLQRHRLGNHLFAVGGNRSAAIANGIRLRPVKMLAFAVAGFCAAAAGVLAAARLGTVAPDAGRELPLQSIAACVVGGLVLTGGRGTVLGMMLGASLIYWIQDVLLLAAAPGYYLDAFVGALIIAAAGLYELMRGRRA